jgi:hypothetical protein
MIAVRSPNGKSKSKEKKAKDTIGCSLSEAGRVKS